MNQVTNCNTRPIASDSGEDFLELSDEQLIREVLSGRRESFGELVLRHAPFVRRVLIRRMANESDREDILQQALLKAFRKLAQFRYEAGFRTWLTRIAINEELQMRRARFSSFLHFDPEGRGPMNPVTDEKASPYDQCCRREQSEYLGRSLDTLPEKYRTVLHLWAMESHTLAEIARTLNLSMPAVKSRLHRARIELRSSWLNGPARIPGRNQSRPDVRR